MLTFAESEISKRLRLFQIIVFIYRKNSRCICIYFRFLEAIMLSDSKVIKFLNYLIDNYISNDTAFPPYLWAGQSANLNRTINACESFHNHLKINFIKVIQIFKLLVKFLLNLKPKQI